MAEERVSTCEGCGAGIYPEHVDSGIAGYHGGRLLCPHCFTDAQKAAELADEEDLKPIAVGEEEGPRLGQGTAMGQSTSIHGFSGDTLASAGAITHDEGRYNRVADPQAPTALRCRTFHSKLNEGAVAYMNDQVNTWVDADPSISIKFATSTIGVFEGKQKDPHLILTVFY